MTVAFVFRRKVFVNSILEHHSQTVFTKTVRISKTGLRGSGSRDVHARFWRGVVHSDAYDS